MAEALAPGALVGPVVWVDPGVSDGVVLVVVVVAWEVAVAVPPADWSPHQPLATPAP